MTHVLHLDVESYSEVDLKKCGAYKNLGHKSSEIMLAQYALDNDPVTLMDFTELHGGRYLQRPMACDLMNYLTDPDILIEAFNATFERLALKLIWGIDLPPERFRCTMVKAYGMGFFGNMGEVGEQMGLNPDKKKLTTGKALIRRFCMPTPGNYKVRRYTRHTHPEEWERFKEYGIQDVVAEREISMLLAPYPLREHEQKLYCLDQRINDHGVLIDIAAVDGATTIDAAEKKLLKTEMAELTGLANPNSGQQLHGWLVEYDFPMENLKAATVEEAVDFKIADAVDEGALDPAVGLEVSKVLSLKQKLAKTAVTKYAAFKRAADDNDQRFRGALQFLGAQRTGRWAARLVQLHNLARPKVKHPEKIAWMLQMGDRDMVHDVHGDVTSYLSNCIRCVIVAPKGKKLVVSDFGSIESRIVAWLSGCLRMTKLFAEGKDSYKDFATELFNIPYDEVTKEQRNYSKPPTLGCFCAETKVLTSSGFKSIALVLSTDELWDGERWVEHDGVRYMGLKKVIKRHGVRATPDHPILVEGKWVQFSELSAQEIDSGVALDHTYDVIHAGPLSRFTIKTSEGLVIAHNCAYQLGPGNKKTRKGGLMEYAKGMGQVMDYDQAKAAVDTFREMYPEIPKMWYWLVEACTDVIKNHTTREGYAVKIFRDNNFMSIQLPSGRKLSYYKPLIEMRIPPWEMDIEPEPVKEMNFITGEWEIVMRKRKPKLKATITYMGKSKQGNKNVRLTTHGGKITENICQAIGMDYIGEAQLALVKETPWPIVLHVHDENVQEVDEGVADEHLKFMDSVMSRDVSWAPGLKMGAAGFVTDRYTKD